MKAKNDEKFDLKNVSCIDCDVVGKVVRKGRAHYVCDACRGDNSLYVALLAEQFLAETND